MPPAASMRALASPPDARPGPRRLAYLGLAALVATLVLLYIPVVGLASRGRGLAQVRAAVGALLPPQHAEAHG